MSERDAICQVCGSDRFTHADVLWPELIAEWALTDEEARYVNVQQGTRCERCGSNVRSQALARAVLGMLGWRGTFDAYLASSEPRRGFRLLEVNEAGTLTPWLSRLRGHEIVRYPEIDLRALPYPDRSFDLVVHSDTLEHVPAPDLALAECRRVLSPDGACVFTVPIVVERLTRRRAGLPPSYHGNPGCREDDHLVQTEFGADAWTGLLRAGFTTCEIVSYRYPAGLALVGRAGGMLRGQEQG